MDNDFSSWCQIINSCNTTDLIKALGQGMHFIDSVCETGTLPEPFADQTVSFCINILRQIIQKMFSVAGSYETMRTDEIFNHFFENVVNIALQSLNTENSYFMLLYDLFSYSDEYEQNNKEFVLYLINLLFSKTNQFESMIEKFARIFPLPPNDYATFYFLTVKFQSFNEDLKVAVISNTTPQFFNTLSMQTSATIRTIPRNVLNVLFDSFLALFLSMDISGEQLYPIYNFLLQAIRCNALEKQLFGAHYYTYIFTNINENNQGMLLQWCVNNNFFGNLVSSHPHVEIIKKLINLFDIMAQNQLISRDTIYELWGQSLTAQVSEKEAYFIVISHCLQTLDQQHLTTFLEMVDSNLDLNVLAQFYKSCITEMANSNEDIFIFLLNLASDKLDYPIFKKIFIELIQLHDENITKKINALSEVWIEKKIYHQTAYEIINCLFKESTIRLNFAGKPFLDYITVGIKQSKPDTKHLYNLLLNFLDYYKIVLPYSNNISLYDASEKPPFWIFMTKLIELRNFESTPEHEKLIKFFIQKENLSETNKEYVEFIICYYKKYSTLCDNSVKKLNKSNKYCLLNPNNYLSYLFNICGTVSNGNCASILTNFLLSLFLNSKMIFKDKIDYFVRECIKIMIENQENSSKLTQIFRLLLSFIDSEEGKIDLSIFKVSRMENSSKLFPVYFLNPKGKYVKIRISSQTSISAIKNVLSALFTTPVEPISIDSNSIPRNYINYNDDDDDENIQKVYVNYKKRSKAKKKSVIDYNYFPVLLLSTEENTEFLIDLLKNEQSAPTAYKLLNRFIFKPIEIDRSPSHYTEVFNSEGIQNPYYFKYMTQRFYRLAKEEIIDYPPDIFSQYLEGLINIVLTKKYKSKYLVKALDILADFYENRKTSAEINNLLEAASNEPKYIFHYLRLIRKLLPEKTGIVVNTDILVKLTKLTTNHETYEMFCSIIKCISSGSSLHSLIVSIITNPIQFTVCEHYIEQIVHTTLLKIPESVAPITEQIVSSFNPKQQPSAVPILCKVLKALFSPEFKNKYDLTAFVTDLLINCAFSSNDEKLQKSIFDLSAIFNDDLQDSFIMSCCSIDSFNFNQRLYNRSFKTMSGLANMGCTCYMNSILQQLSANNKVIASFAQSTQQLRPDIQQLLELFINQRFGLRNYYSTSSYCEAYSKFNTEFRTHEQEDAVEFFNMLLEACPAETKQLFEGKLKHTLSRGEIDVQSQILSERQEIFTTVDVSVAGIPDLSTSLRHFLAPERLTKDNAYVTESGEEVEAFKYTRFSTLPRFLVFHLKRFEYNLSNYTRYKINSSFEFPTTLNMSEFSDEGNLYRLKGAVIHMGVAEGGHYVSVVRRERKWILCDDSSLSEMTEESFLNMAFGDDSTDRNAYLLFFERDENSGENAEVSDTTLFGLLPEELRNSIAENGKIITKNCALLTKSCYNYFLNRNPSQISVQYFFGSLCHSVDTNRIVEFAKHIENCKIYIMNSIGDLIEILNRINNGNETINSIIDLIGKSTDTECVQSFLSQATKITENNDLLNKVGRIFETAASNEVFDENGFNMISQFISTNFADKEDISSFDLSIYYEVIILASGFPEFSIDPIIPIILKTKQSEVQLLSSIRLLISRGINGQDIDEVFIEGCDKLQMYKLISYLTIPATSEQALTCINTNNYSSIVDEGQNITVEGIVSELINLVKNGSSITINTLMASHQIIIDLLLNPSQDVRGLTESLVVALFLLRHSNNNPDNNNYEFDNYIPSGNHSTQTFVDDLILNITNLPNYEESGATSGQIGEDENYVSNFKLLAYFRTLCWLASSDKIKCNLSSEVITALSSLIQINSSKGLNPNYNIFEICRFIEKAANDESDSLIVDAFKAFFSKDLLEETSQSDTINYINLFQPIITSFESRNDDEAENLLKSKQYLKICKQAASVTNYKEYPALTALAEFINSIKEQSKEYRKRFRGLFEEEYDDDDENEE